MLPLQITLASQDYKVRLQFCRSCGGLSRAILSYKKTHIPESENNFYTRQETTSLVDFQSHSKEPRQCGESLF